MVPLPLPPWVACYHGVYYHFCYIPWLGTQLPESSFNLILWCARAFTSLPYSVNDTVQDGRAPHEALRPTVPLRCHTFQPFTLATDAVPTQNHHAVNIPEDWMVRGLYHNARGRTVECREPGLSGVGTPRYAAWQTFSSLHLDTSLVEWIGPGKKARMAACTWPAGRKRFCPCWWHFAQTTPLHHRFLFSYMHYLAYATCTRRGWDSGTCTRLPACYTPVNLVGCGPLTPWLDMCPPHCF